MSNHTPPPIISTSSASGSKPSLIDPGTAEPRGAFCPAGRDYIIELLRDLGACDEALDWIAQTPGKPADLWAACQDYNWMIWLLEHLGYSERTLRHIACDCAEGVLHIYERAYPDDRRPRDAIAVARRYADGAATDDELIAARDAAWAAAQAAARAAAGGEDAASDAACAASWAAASDAAGTVANYAAADYAASAAARAAEWSAACWSAAWVAAWDAAMSRHADMIRARVSWADVEQAIAAVGAQEALSK